jgi:hypothetical protein
VETAEKITKSLGSAGFGKEAPIQDILREFQIESIVTKLGSTRSLSELYLASNTWPQLTQLWAGDSVFSEDIQSLIAEGLVEKRGKGYIFCTLTDLGMKVAKLAEAKGLLWSQIHNAHWKDERARLAEAQSTA